MKNLKDLFVPSVIYFTQEDHLVNLVINHMISDTDPGNNDEGRGEGGHNVTI